MVTSCSSGVYATTPLAPQVQLALMNAGISLQAAQSITQLAAIGSGSVLLGNAGAASAANEVSNNFLLAIPAIVEGVIAGGSVAARACLSSPG